MNYLLKLKFALTRNVLLIFFLLLCLNSLNAKNHEICLVTKSDLVNVTFNSGLPLNNYIGSPIGFSPLENLPLATKTALASVNFLVSNESELRTAVTSAVDGDVITLKNSIVITNSDIAIASKQITINGSGFELSVPRPGLDDMGRYNTSPSLFRVFNCSGTKTIIINNLNIKGGATSAPGGAINIQSGTTLKFNNCVISNSLCSAGGGGGIANSGVLYMNNSFLRRNAASYAGALLNSGSSRAYIESSTMIENRSTSSSGGGGAVESQSGSIIYFNNSTLSNNQSTEIGGAINNYRGTVYFINSSATGNVAFGSFQGGAIGNNSGNVYILNSLFAHNYRRTGGSVTSPTSYVLDDFAAYSAQSNVRVYYSIYHATLPSGMGATLSNIQYTGNANGSNNSIFSGGLLSKITDNSGVEIGDQIYRPFLYNNQGSVAPTLQVGSFISQSQNRGTLTRFSNNDNNNPAIAYFYNNAWVNLLGTSTSGQEVVLDQVGSTRSNPPAIGAIDGETSASLYIVKVNGATGGTVDGGTIYGDVYASGTSVTLTAIASSGKQFVRWDYVAGGSGVASTNNPYTFSVTQDVTLVPVFSTLAAGNYTITYIGNGNTGGNPPSGGTFSASTTISGLGSLEQTGYQFIGWNTNENGSGTSYSAGATYSLGANLTLYAIWRQVSSVASPIITSPQTLCSGSNSLLNVNVTTGQNVQWYANASGGVVLNTTTSITSGTYYATQTIGGIESDRTAVVITVIPNLTSAILSAISGPTTATLDGNITLSISPVTGATSYVWDLPSGMVISSSSNGGATVVVAVGNNFAGGTVKVKATNSCSSSAWKTKIYYGSANSASIAITTTYVGAPVICGGVTNVPFSVTSLAGATYLWTLPAGISLSSGSTGTESTVYLDFASNYQGGNISVVRSTATGSAVGYYAVAGLPTPSNLTGPTALCGITSASYTIASVANATSYEWSLPTGMTITDGSGTTMIQTSWTGSVSGTIKVRAVGDCGYSNWSSISVGSIAPPSSITGPAIICGAAVYTITNNTMTSVSQTTLNYSVTEVAGMNYTWSVPTGMTIASGQGTSAIVVTVAPSSFTSGQITVTAASSSSPTCVSSARTLSITKGISTITGPTALCGLTTATYSVPSASGLAFTWNVPTWMTIVSGQGTNQINVAIASSGTSAQTLSLSLTTNCGTQELSTTVGCGLYTQLANTFCGQTLASINSGIAATIIPSATSYTFAITYNNQTYNVVSSDCWITLSEATDMPLVYGATYAVSVKVQNAGVWGNYGSVCSVTIPSIPTTQLTNAFCGQTLTSIGSGIAATIIPSATSYTFEINYNGQAYTVVSSDCWITLSEASGMPLVYGATYAIKVKVQNAGVWGVYGSSCSVTAPSIPTTQLTNAFCGQTLASINSGIAATIIPSATSYTFAITYNGSTYNVVSSDCWITLSEATGMPIVYGANYSVSVTVQNGSQSGVSGSVCTVTTPAGIPTTQLTNAFCGQTLASIGSGISANIISGATNYNFAITYNGSTYNVVSPDCWISLSEASGMPLVYGATYSVSVSIQNGGVWGNPGSACTVTIPAGIPTTQLNTSYCSQTLLNLNSGIAATIVSAATNYKFAITYSGTNYYVTSSDCWITLSEASGMPLIYGATYAVSVSVQNGTQWSSYGTTCNVSTPVIPVSQLTSAFCGQTLPTIGSGISATIIPAASSYGFAITYNGTTYNVESSDCWITLSEATGMPLVYGATYAISVKVKHENQWGSYGASCNVTAPSIPMTQLTNAFCGQTLASINSGIAATIIPSATSYTFAITYNNQTYTVVSSDCWITLSEATGMPLVYGAIYAVSVKVQNAGVWGNYGTSCNVTTPGIPTTQLTSTFCGQMLVSINSGIAATIIPAATSYTFAITYNSITYTVVSSDCWITLSEATGMPLVYGATYAIKVSIQNGTSSGSYGSSCNVTTPTNISTTQLQTSQCDYTAVSTTEIIHAILVSNATNYRFSFTNTALSYGYIFDTNNLGSFGLDTVPGLLPSTTYSVKVSAQIAGVWGAYGKACTLTTPGTAKTIAPMETATLFDATAYPNPFAENFKLNVKSSSQENIQVKVYDMLGKLLENRILDATEVEAFEIGVNYPSGVYNVIVSQGDAMKALRVIKR